MAVRIIRKKRITKILALVLSLTVISTITMMGVEWFNQSNPVQLVDSKYECQFSGCNYSITALNESEIAIKGFARLNAFIDVNGADHIVKRLYVSERLEFILEPKERKVIEDFLITKVKVTLITFDVGYINDNI